MDKCRDNERLSINLLCQKLSLDKNRIISTYPQDPPDFIYDEVIGIEHTELNYNYPGPMSVKGIEAGYWKIMGVIKSYTPPFGIYPDKGTSSKLVEHKMKQTLAFLKDNQWNISLLESTPPCPEVRVVRSEQSGDIIITDKNDKYLSLRCLFDSTYLSCYSAGNQSSDVGDNIVNAVTGAILDKAYKLKKKDLKNMSQWLLLEDTHYQYMVNEGAWIFITKNIDRSIFKRIFVVNIQTELVVELKYKEYLLKGILCILWKT